jgi:serine protease Do
VHAWSLFQADAAAQSRPRDGSLPSFVDVIARLRPAVVNVAKASTSRAPGSGTGVDSLGSGVVVTSDGYVATNAHVLAEADTLVVRLSNRDDYVAAVAYRDAAADVALLKIDPKAKLTPAALLPAGGAVRPGEWVLDQTVTAGIVSATGRVIGSGPYDALLQTDAAINAGNSGGPLVNVRGEVVGLTAAATSGVAIPGIGFAVPVDAVRRALERARADR